MNVTQHLACFSHLLQGEQFECRIYTLKPSTWEKQCVVHIISRTHLSSRNVECDRCANVASSWIHLALRVTSEFRISL